MQYSAALNLLIHAAKRTDTSSEFVSDVSIYKWAISRNRQIFQTVWSQAVHS